MKLTIKLLGALVVLVCASLPFPIVVLTLPTYATDWGLRLIVVQAYIVFSLVAVIVWLVGRKNPIIRRSGWVLIPLGLGGIVTIVEWLTFIWFALAGIADSMQS